MAFALNDEKTKLTETKSVVIEEDIAELLRMREHYNGDIIYYTNKLAEVEAKIAAAKQLGFVEVEKS